MLGAQAIAPAAPSGSGNAFEPFRVRTVSALAFRAEPVAASREYGEQAFRVFGLDPLLPVRSQQAGHVGVGQRLEDARFPA